MTPATRTALIVATLLTSLFGPAQAESTWSKASSLGAVLGSEAACTVTLDTTAIQKWISANVDASDMKFTGDLVLATGVTQNRFTGMSQSLKEAYCAQTRRLVEKLGLGGTK